LVINENKADYIYIVQPFFVEDEEMLFRKRYFTLLIYAMNFVILQEKVRWTYKHAKYHLYRNSLTFRAKKL